MMSNFEYSSTTWYILVCKVMWDILMKIKRRIVRKIDQWFDRCGTTALHCAVKRGDRQEVYRLIADEDADVDKKDDYGFTSLMIASHRRDHQMLQLLAYHTRRSSIWEHALYVFYKDFEELHLRYVFERLIRIDFERYLGNSPLHLILKRLPYEIEVIQMLLDGGSDPNILDPNGNNYLHIICGMITVSPHQKALLAIMFIDNGVDIDAKDASSFTPLHLAIINNDMLLTTVLLKKGANVNLRNYLKLNVFDLAIRTENFDMDVLIKYIVLNKHRTFVRKEIIQGICRFPDLKTIYKQYETDINSWKQVTIIESSHFTYYNLLTSGIYRLANLLRNEEFVEAVGEPLPSNPYQNEVLIRYSEGYKRKVVDDLAFEVVNSLLGNKLPYVCIKHICNYFGNKDKPMLKSFLDSHDSRSHRH